MRSVRDNVIRQALIEYVMIRAPDAFDDENPTDADIDLALQAYIERRYPTHGDAFRRTTKIRLIPNIRAAMDEINLL